MTPEFQVDPRILASSAELDELRLCQARLQLDRRWPWIVLVPKRPGLIELDDLALKDRERLLSEIAAAGRAVRAVGVALGFDVEKLNVGALGNVVSQLHVHVVGRRHDDPAWPCPVWGFGQPEPLSPTDADRARPAAVNALRA